MSARTTRKASYGLPKRALEHPAPRPNRIQTTLKPLSNPFQTTPKLLPNNSQVAPEPPPETAETHPNPRPRTFQMPPDHLPRAPKHTQTAPAHARTRPRTAERPARPAARLTGRMPVPLSSRAPRTVEAQCCPCRPPENRYIMARPKPEAAAGSLKTNCWKAPEMGLSLISPRARDAPQIPNLLRFPHAPATPPGHASQ